MTFADTRPQLVNLRDVGGVRTEDGETVATGVLYRSEAPLAGDAVPGAVPHWPVRTVVDLRSGSEIDGGHPLESPMTRVHHLPLGRSLTPDSALRRSPVSDLASLYLNLVNKTAPRIAEIITTIADSPGPTLVHCAAGKDRTGIIVGILLRATGVRRADVLADYLKTDTRLPLLWARLRDAGTELPDDPVLLSVAPDALAGVLDLVESHPGGVRRWLTDGGAPLDIADRLRALLLV